MNHVAVAKVLVRNSEGRYLILRGSVWPERPDRSQKPDVPGGLVDYGENHEEAAVRELKEEAGIAISRSDLKLVYAHSVMKEDKNEALVWLLYIVELPYVPSVKISWEHEAYMWLNKGELLNLEIRDPYPNVFRYLDRIEILV